MNKPYPILGVLVLSTGFTMQGWAANPCLPIAKACMQAGYYKGGNKVGKGLIMDCVLPIVKTTKTLPNVTFSDSVRQLCKEKLAEKMKGI